MLATGALAIEPPHNPTQARQELMDYACLILYWECEGIAPPEIVYGHLPYGIAGRFYPGTNKIYLSVDYRDTMPPLVFMSVIVHEMVHYIDDQLHDLTLVDKAAACRAEARAWHVNNAFLIWVGYEEYVDYRWPSRYGCPAPGVVTGP